MRPISCTQSTLSAVHGAHAARSAAAASPRAAASSWYRCTPSAEALWPAAWPTNPSVR
ncbi:MAG: hypothetical protein WKG00_02235 [Polyangiaceae bacterium]